MYAFIEGVLAERHPTAAVVNAHGVGYYVEISLHTYEQLANQQQVRLLTHLVVRDDAFMLYGFAHEAERRLFRMLIQVNGVGPNVARTMLSSLAPEEIEEAISRKDEALIRSVKGIGAKTAQRVVLELHDKIAALSDLPVGAPPSSAPTHADAPQERSSTQTRQEAITALVHLGYNRPAAEKAIQSIYQRHPELNTTEALIKMALKTL